MAILNESINKEDVIITSKSWFQIDKVWNLLPIFMLFAAYLPIILKAISKFGQEEFEVKYNHWFLNLINKIFGTASHEIIAFLPAALGAYAIFKIIKIFDCPNWCAAIFSSFYIAAPVIGLQPNFFNNPHDGLFAAFIGISFLECLLAIKNSKQSNLAFAFIFSVLACLMRPMAAWPMFAVFISIILTTKAFEDRSKWGLISALCWGPMLFYASEFAKLFKNPNFSWLSPQIDKAININLNDNLSYNINEFSYYFLNSIPVILLLILSFLTLIYLFKNLKDHKILLFAFIIFFSFSILGAIGYGDIVAARFLLDILALSIIPIGLINFNNVNFFKLNNIK